jgi:putative FmdB family regulatory protein
MAPNPLHGSSRRSMTYEYRCHSCGHRWEAEQKISEPPLRRCPRCKRRAAERLASGGTGHVLKGSGWARNGYRG